MALGFQGGPPLRCYSPRGDGPNNEFHRVFARLLRGFVEVAVSKEPCSDSPNPDLPKTYLIRIGRVVSWTVNLNSPTLTPELDPKIPKTTLVAGHSLASTQWGFVGLAVASSQPCRFLGYKIIRLIRQASGNLCMFKHWTSGTSNKQMGKHAECLPVLGKPVSKMSPSLELAKSGTVLAEVTSCRNTA